MNFELMLIWVHLLMLGAGGAAVVGIPVVASVMDDVDDNVRPVLQGRVEALGRIGSVALGMVIVTGLGLVGLRSGVGGDPGWFWIKMALVVAFVVAIVLAKRNGAAAMAGDRSAARRLKALSMLELVCFALVILAAVMAFA